MNKEFEPTTVLDEAALVIRLRSAELASTNESGTVNYAWLVLHLWIAQCDMVRSDQLRRNANSATSDQPQNLLTAYKHLFSQVLPVVLPLMDEFIDPEMFCVWREAGYLVEPANDPRFLECAVSAGVPISIEDLIYALGFEGPFGREIFLSVENQVQTARAH